MSIVLQYHAFIILWYEDKVSPFIKEKLDTHFQRCSTLQVCKKDLD